MNSSPPSLESVLSPNVPKALELIERSESAY